MFFFKANLLLRKSVEKLALLAVTEKQPLNMWNKSQSFYIQNLGKTYTEIYIYDCFKKIVDKCQDKNTKIMLFKFLKLYSLTIFENDFGLLRHNDFISSEAPFIIREEILSLCNDLKNELIGILDVISPPDFILNSAFGLSDGKMIENYFNKIMNYNSWSKDRPDVFHKKHNF